jgi:hypothetical protein
MSSENAICSGSRTAIADVDQRLIERQVVDTSGTMSYRDFVIGDQGLIAEPLEDLTDSYHAKSVQFGRAESAHTGGPEDVHSLT